MSELLLPVFQHAGHALIVIGALLFAYTLFALVGFGSALVASTPLAMVMSVNTVIPLLALLDSAGASRRGWQQRQQVSWAHLRQLLLGMLAGQLAGVMLLRQLPLALMAQLLGGFVLCYGLHSLWQAQWPPDEAAQRYPAWLAGLSGGALGGLFGSGGFVYASYLQRQLPREAFRATQAVLIALSTLWRIALCALSGLIDYKLLAAALLLLPLVFAGNWLGSHIDIRLSQQRLTLLLNLLLVASGARLLAIVW